MSDDDLPFKWGAEFEFKLDDFAFRQLAQSMYGDAFLSPRERVVRDYTQLKNRVFVDTGAGSVYDRNIRYRVERDQADGSLWLIAEAPYHPIINPLSAADLMYSPYVKPDIEWREQLRTPITHDGMKRLVFELIDTIDDLNFTEEAMGLMDDWVEE